MYCIVCKKDTNHKYEYVRNKNFLNIGTLLRGTEKYQCKKCGNIALKYDRIE